VTTPGQYNLTDLMNLMRQLSPLQAGAGSDELNRAYLAAQAQQNAALLGQSVQFLNQDQTNQMRMMELMGQSGGVPTDAAQRWRSELLAQQGIQGTRLQQEYAQLMGYGVDAQGNLTQQQTLGGRQQTLAEQQAAQQNQQRLYELMGFGPGGVQTLAREQFGNEVQQAELQRRQQMALLNTQQNFQGAESAQERAARLQLQREQLQFQGGESQQERDLRERLQAGQLGQQEAEFARTYLLQQAQSRRQQAELAGYMTDENGNTTGQLTEAARAARSGEATQRAALAAQLMQSPKDVFRAGAYFRSLRGANPAAMGLQGGGVMGFNSAADRAAIGLPGTLTPDDVINATGGDLSQQGGATQQFQALGAVPGAAEARAQGASAGTGASATSTDTTGGGWGSASGAPAGSSEGTSTTEREGQEEQTAGLSPGGPVGSAVDRQLGDLGMGAGGAMAGRAPAAATAASSSIPYIDPRVFEEPAIQQMTRELRRIGRSDAQTGGAGRARGPSGPVGRAERRAGTTPARVEVGPYRFGEQSARDRQAATERFLRGVALVNQRTKVPGMSPGGPVDAPLWPDGTGGTATPQLQDAGSLGGSSFQAPISEPVSLAQAASSFTPGGIGSVDPATQDYAMGQAAQMVQGGIGNVAPQIFEQMSKTQRGTLEGAFEALGLNPDDVMQAYAQTRFANTGNVLSA